MQIHLFLKKKKHNEQNENNNHFWICEVLERCDWIAIIWYKIYYEFLFTD